MSSGIENFVLKFEEKHGVTADEVEEVLFSRPYIGRAEAGKVRGEQVYVASGQTADPFTSFAARPYPSRHET
jgi:hypothetical protein